jgi:hypothetical protein
MKLGLPPAGSKSDARIWADRMEADSLPHVPKAPHSAAERYPALRSPVVRSPVVHSPVVRSPESAVRQSAVTACAVARDEAKSGAPRARHFEAGRSPVVRSPESAVKESAVTVVCFPKAAAMLGALTIPLAAELASS